MFTEEEKIRAIELYFKYGKKLAPVVRELGYPSKGICVVGAAHGKQVVA